MSASRRLLFVTVLAALSACTRVDVVARGPCVKDADCASGRCVQGVCAPATDAGSDAATSDASTPDGGSGFCAQSGPIVFVGDSTGTPVCGGEVAQTTFRYAICSCLELALSAPLSTDAFDSREGPYTQGSGGAAVGTNGRLISNMATLGIGGSLTVSGSSGVAISGAAGASVRGDLASGGSVTGSGSFQILGDARVNGDVAASALQVGGSFVYPSGATLSVSPGPLSVGSTVRAPVTVAPPCDCGAPPRLDVAGYVSAQAASNENATIGLATTALASVTTDTTLELPCGRYYLAGIGTAAGSSAEIRVRALGRVALFVDGSIDVAGRFVVEVGPGAEIDLFVSDGIRTTLPLAFGDVTRPSSARLYVGGSGSIALDAGATIAGNVYAPLATLQTAGSFVAYGSIFAYALQSSADLTVHYDRAILAAAQGCPPRTGGCVTCLDCGNQACVNGSCAPCRNDADCCAPLVCAGGSCVPDIQ